jgi:hypothetical protein
MEITLDMDKVLLFVLIVLGFVSIFLASKTKMLGEDEANYFVLSKEFYNLKFPTFDRFGYPKLLPIYYSLLAIPFFPILGTSLLTLKTMTGIFFLLTLILLYTISKRHGINMMLMSISLLLLTPIYIQFVPIAYVEIPIAFFSLLVICLIMNLSNTKQAILLGSLLFISILVKSSGLIFSVFFVLFFLYKYFFEKDKKYFKLFFTTIIIEFILILPWVIRNMIFFNLPGLLGINDVVRLFIKPKIPYQATWIREISQKISVPLDYFNTFGFLPLLFLSISSVYFYFSRDKHLLIPISMCFLFFILYYVRGALSLGISEPRYFSIIIPLIAFSGGYFVSRIKMQEKNTKLIISSIIIGIFIYSIYYSWNVESTIAQSQRYPDDYVEALKWLKQNTPKDAIIFTTYGGSVSVFADRDSFWTLEEFPEIMTTKNSTYIYDILKNKYNFSYILLWKGVLAENYYVPETNLIGAFTYNFLDTVSNNSEHFPILYQNQNNIIFEIK